MARGLVVLLLIIIATLLIFDVCNMNARAQGGGSLNQVIENQKLILEKLDALDKKLDVIKIRIRT